jgi:hypothetical protein
LGQGSPYCGSRDRRQRRRPRQTLPSSEHSDSAARLLAQATGAVPQVPPLPPAPEDYEERQRIEVDFRDADNSRSEGADDLLVKGTAFVRDLMWAMPIPSIRANYGISRFSLNRYCRENNIAAPGRGYWKNSTHPAVTGDRDPEPSIPATHHAQGGDPPEDRSDVSVEAHDGGVHSPPPVIQTVELEEAPPTVSLSSAAMADSLKTEFDAMRLLWRESVDAWLATFPNQSSNAVRRIQVLNGLFAVVRSGRVVNSSDLVRLTSEEIDRICDEFLFNGTNRNSVRAYRSMLKSFRAYLEPQSAETSETASSPGLEVLFEPSAHKGLYREWELMRDMAIASLAIRDGFTAEEIAIMDVPRDPQKLAALRSTTMIRQYVAALPPHVARLGGGPLFRTPRGEPIYREFVGKAIRGLCESAGVEVRSVSELRRSLAWR